MKFYQNHIHTSDGDKNGTQVSLGSNVEICYFVWRATTQPEQRQNAHVYLGHHTVTATLYEVVPTIFSYENILQEKMHDKAGVQAYLIPIPVLDGKLTVQTYGEGESNSNLHYTIIYRKIGEI